MGLVGFFDVNHDALQPLLELEDSRLVNSYALVLALELGDSVELLVLELANESGHGMGHEAVD